MAKKKKVRRLTDEQYNAYITSLKYDPASYNADGSRVVPDELNARGEAAPKAVGVRPRAFVSASNRIVGGARAFSPRAARHISLLYLHRHTYATAAL